MTRRVWIWVRREKIRIKKCTLVVTRTYLVRCVAHSGEARCLSLRVYISVWADRRAHTLTEYTTLVVLKRFLHTISKWNCWKWLCLHSSHSWWLQWGPIPYLLKVSLHLDLHFYVYIIFFFNFYHALLYLCSQISKER